MCENITWEELKREIDKYSCESPVNIELTEEQRDFLVTCKEKRVPYRKQAELWSKLGWGDVSASTIGRIYKKQILTIKHYR